MKSPDNLPGMPARSPQKSSDGHQLIIDQPSLQKPFVRGMQVLISASAWALFLYFFQTLLTAIFWMIGGEFLYHRILVPESVEGTKQLLLAAFYFAILAFLILFGWAQWNYWRFGRLERRKPRPPVSDEAVALYYGISVRTVYAARAAKIAKIISQGTRVELIMEMPLNPERLCTEKRDAYQP